MTFGTTCIYPSVRKYNRTRSARLHFYEGVVALDDIIAFHLVLGVIREIDTFSIRQKCIFERDAMLDLLYDGSKFPLERDWYRVYIIHIYTFSFSLPLVFIKVLFINTMLPSR